MHVLQVLQSDHQLGTGRTIIRLAATHQCPDPLVGVGRIVYPREDVSGRERTLRAVGELFGQTSGHNESANLGIECIGRFLTRGYGLRILCAAILRGKLRSYFVGNRLLEFWCERGVELEAGGGGGALPAAC